MALELDATPEIRGVVQKNILQFITDTKPDVGARKEIYTIRRDMFEGRHHKYTNVVGLTSKEQSGHVLPVFNYVQKLGRHLQRVLTNNPFKFRVISDDESNKIENLRAEGVEDFIGKVLYDNKFQKTTFKRGGLNQIRDGNFAIKCWVEVDKNGDRAIKIVGAEDLSKLHVLWDDSSGTSFSALAYVDEWSVAKVKREFGADIEIPDTAKDTSNTSGGQQGDEYGTTTGTGVAGSRNMYPDYKGKNAKVQVADYWGWAKVPVTEEDEEGETQVTGSEYKVINAILLGKGDDSSLVQYIETDYRRIPWFIGHCEPNPGKPWSGAFIDNIIDANIELNDRSGEEADLIRAGANKKYLAINMPDFDPQSIRTGSAQVIFIEGEDADFRQLSETVNIFPSESYTNKTMEHLFNLGLPRIAIASGTAPYTGRAGAIQYQPVADTVQDLRDNWDVVLQDLFDMIQEYAIDYFPETAELFKIATMDEDGRIIDSEPTLRKIGFDWDSPTPLSRSDRVVDAVTLYDRKAIPLRKLLEEVGYDDPARMIKELKEEWKDEDLVAIRTRFEELGEGVRTAQNEARREQLELEEEILAEQQGAQGGTPENQPILTQGNSERRGVSQARGVPNTGQTVSQQGDARATQQNINAQRGV